MNRRVRAKLPFIFALSLPLFAQDSRLTALHETLLTLRSSAGQNVETRDAIPQLTIAKHQLRDWIESRLRPLARTGDEEVLAREINTQLGSIALPPLKQADGEFWAGLGVIGPMRLSKMPGG